MVTWTVLGLEPLSDGTCRQVCPRPDGGILGRDGEQLADGRSSPLQPGGGHARTRTHSHAHARTRTHKFTTLLFFWGPGPEPAGPAEQKDSPSSLRVGEADGGGRDPGLHSRRSRHVAAEMPSRDAHSMNTSVRPL